MTRQLWHFHGGIHVEDDRKALSNGRPVVRAPLPKRLVLPLHQHIGAPAKPVVAVGDKVLKGQMIARPEGFVSVPVHAPSSGTVVALEPVSVPHPSGLSALSIVIETDGADTWCEREPVRDYQSLEASHLRNLIRDAGIVGLGGAGFPAFIKLNPGARTEVDTLILNGAECEPYITCDDLLMRERAQEVIAGARIMRHALHAHATLIGIEDNKPEAAAALRQALADLDEEHIEVVVVPTRYPAGGEKQLIRVLTGKEVPSGGLPLDVGIVCHNVATAVSVHRAVELGEPLISRYVTVTGEAVREPGNWEVLLGTPVAELVALAGGTRADADPLLMGGPMMGFGLDTDQAPVVKTTNCILAMRRSAPAAAVRPCIRCGACAEVCPAQLLPQQLYWYARAKDFDKVQDYNLFDCIECGCCAYVCPSRLPLVQYYRFAKTEIWSQERDKKAADLARRRHEFQQARKEQEQAEKAARAAKKKAALADGDKAADDKKAAIQAAMERAKAKKAAAAPKNTDDLSDEQRAKIAAVEERRRRAASADQTAQAEAREGKE